MVVRFRFLASFFEVAAVFLLNASACVKRFINFSEDENCKAKCGRPHPYAICR